MMPFPELHENARFKTPLLGMVTYVGTRTNTEGQSMYVFETKGGIKLPLTPQGLRNCLDNSWVRASRSTHERVFRISSGEGAFTDSFTYFERGEWEKARTFMERADAPFTLEYADGTPLEHQSRREVEHYLIKQIK